MIRHIPYTYDVHWEVRENADGETRHVVIQNMCGSLIIHPEDWPALKEQVQREVDAVNQVPIRP